MINKQKKDLEKRALLIQVARLYYEQDYSQSEVAKAVNLSRPYISKLLNEAKETGIVKISIVDSVDSESALERKIREYFNLRKVIIVPDSSTQNALRQVAEATAVYLESILKSNDIIGYSWGETIYECAKAFPATDSLKNITTVQMCGGISNTNKGVYVTEISREFATKMNSSNYIMPFPAIVDDAKMKQVLDQDHSMRQILQLAEKINISMVTMGRFNLQCALSRAGYLSPPQIERLVKSGVVGDICTHLIDSRGNICDEELDSRTVAVPFDIIRNIDTRIGIAIGESKLHSIYGALKGGLTNVFISNESTVNMLINLHPEIMQ